jgi:hypothetical protein
LRRDALKPTIATAAWSPAPIDKRNEIAGDDLKKVEQAARSALQSKRT